MSAGKLYVVATPIGNLGDISSRAIEVLRSVEMIACEDTRRSRILLDAYGVKTPLTALFEGNEKARAGRISETLAQGGSAAIVSEAGTPNISDPGFRLVAACIEKGVEVIAVPGPSAPIAALSISGLPTDAFIFEGFLPPKPGARMKKIESWKSERRTVIFFESPHRIVRTLIDLKAAFGDIRIVVAREMTKKFEEVIRSRLSELVARFESKKPLGEFTVLFNLKAQEPRL